MILFTWVVHGFLLSLKLKTMKYRLLLASLFTVLFFPVFLAPQYADADERTLSSLKIGVVKSSNTVRAYEYISNPANNPFEGSAARYQRGVEDSLTEALSYRFKSFDYYATPAAAIDAGVDIVLIFDFDASLHGAFIPTTVSISATFMDRNMKTLARIKGNGSETLTGWGFFVPLNMAFEKLQNGIDRSRKLRKYAAALPVSKPQTAPIVTATKSDSTPPFITITSHGTSRSIKVVENSSQVRIEGKATDMNGVSEVLINGESAYLNAEGNFFGNVLLRIGENKISVIAIDTKKNIAKKSFIIQREAKEIPAKKIDIDNANDYGKFHALVIGVDNYQYLPRLKTANNDAIDIGKILREKFGFHTVVLLDASRNEILESLNDFRKKLGQNDSFLIYYAGHGEFDKKAERAYWLPVDAKPDSDVNWIIVDTITSNIRRFSSRHIMIVADSCYSGTLTRRSITNVSSHLAREQYLNKMLGKTSRTLIASGGNEPVADSGGEGHSVFAEVFLRALKTEDKKVFTAEEIFYGAIKESVAGRAEQTPEYSIIRNSGHDGGDFLFVRD